MSLSDGNPARIVGKLMQIGLPWHGLVTAGSLALPNSQTMIFPQPATGDYSWQQGDVHLVKSPAVPETPIVLTADDVAEGRQWLRYAMLSGAQQALGGKSLNGWIWFDVAGQAWRIRYIGRSVASGQITFNFGVRKFGIFGEESDEVAVSTAALTIPAPTVTVQARGFGGSWADVSHTDISLLHLSSVSPNGSKAIFMAAREHYPESIQGSTAMNAIHRAIAFFEIEVVSASSIVASVVRDYDQCVGSYSMSQSGGMDYGAADPASHRLHVFKDLLSTGVWNTCGDPPADRQEWIYEGRIQTSVEQAGAAIVYYLPRSMALSTEWVGQTVAVWYDAAGVRHTITLDFVHAYSRTVTSAANTAGTERQYYTCDGVLTFEGAISADTSFNVAATESVTVRIRDNGLVVASSVVSYGNTINSTYGAANISGNKQFTVSGSATSSLDAAQTASGSLSWDEVTGSGLVDYYGPYINNASYAYATAEADTTGVRRFGVFPYARRVSEWLPAGFDYRLSFSRLSSQMVMLHSQWHEVFSAPVEGQHVFSALATPYGTAAAPASLPLSTHSEIKGWGSMQPVTAQAAVSIVPTSATLARICWV